ncbi:sulfite exporter TauE/SafE family protein [bacterium]|nr:sulfite exporter TauE/SafE family protein [bacterium]
MVSVLWGAFALSLFGSIHCMGMCGGFALLAKGTSSSAFSTSLLIYLTGKTITYAALGLFLGLLGGTLHHSPLGSKVLAIVVGLIMIWIGLDMAGANFISTSSRFSSFVGRISMFNLISWLQRAASKHGMQNKLFLGVLNGLLPCGLLYAALAGAAQTGNPVEGSLFMVVFGLGTFPSLFVAANVVSLLSPQKRLRLSQITGWLIAAYGVITLLRGTGVVSAMMH